MEMTNKTVREIALEIPASTKVFEELKIDYCCGGNVNLKEACEKADIEPALVEEKIASVAGRVPESPDFDSGPKASMAMAIELIVEKHHSFTRNEIARLKPLMEKVAGKHGEKHPFLLKLREVFNALSADLLPHMQKEEFVLFPYIIDMENAAKRELAIQQPPFGTVQNPVRMMNAEHEEAGLLLKEIRAITTDFAPPADCCPSFKALYFGLEELEKDLHHHIHLENNILFPKAVELESRLCESTD